MTQNSTRGPYGKPVLDQAVKDLGEIVWIIDLNRQSLDRVIPNIAVTKIERLFEAAGWQVLTAKFGSALEEVLSLPGCDSLRERITEMPNPEYQRLLRCSPASTTPRCRQRSATSAATISTHSAPRSPLSTTRGRR